MLSKNFATGSARREFAKTWTYPNKGGAAAAESLIFFSATENKILAAACNVAGRSGFFLTLNVLKDLMVRVMKTEGREGGRRWSAENEQEISHAYMRKWLIIRRTGWLTLGYELAATYGLGKHGSKMLREDELNEQSALYMRAAADCNFIELAVFLERSPESQSSHGSLGAIFSDEEVANED